METGTSKVTLCGFLLAVLQTVFIPTRVVNPRRACAARVTVVVLCVCMCVCLCVRNRIASKHQTEGINRISEMHAS